MMPGHVYTELKDEKRKTGISSEWEIAICLNKLPPKHDIDTFLKCEFNSEEIKHYDLKLVVSLWLTGRETKTDF